MLWLFLARRTDLLAGERTLLHVAPEPLLAEVLSRRPLLAYVSVDLDSPSAMARMDLTRLAFRDRSFDAILCLHVLEHVSDDRKAIREMLRVLRPQGWAILQSPVENGRAETFEDWGVTSAAERERIFGQRDHVRIYGRDYVARLAAAGFEVEEIPPQRLFSEDEIRRHGLDPAERITLCAPGGSAAC